MRHFGILCIVELKRVKKLLPSALVFALALLFCIGALGKFMMTLNGSEEKKTPLKIVIVGDTSDAYFQFALKSIRQLDLALMQLDVETCTEKEAERLMRAGELTLYLKIPDGFVESVFRGENRQIAIVTEGRQKNLNNFVVREAADACSVYIICSQNGIFAMQRYLTDNGMTDDFERNTFDLNLRYFNSVLDRHAMVRTEEAGYGKSLSFAAYYICSLSVFALLLLGMVCSPYLIGRKREFQKLLAARGMEAGKQVTAEYLAFFAAMSVCFATVFLIFAISMSKVFTAVPEWKDADLQRVLHFGLHLWPVTGMICALHFFLYELVTGTVTKLIVQFLGAVGMGYLSGCIYPANFFPEGMQRLGEALPSGTALLYAQNCLLEESARREGVLLIVETVLFLGAAVAVRKYKLERV